MNEYMSPLGFIYVLSRITVQYDVQKAFNSSKIAISPC